ncbi:MAG: hypothetical protein HN742_43085 [Lentisphaerae bacterium]|jgi:hypothetical protein|nr:hypothetical protein [Lentisphaerota bacterium]MBT4818476.1 hypothetical protein [Lentisphaerota bacterium]MBT5604301.1 hypothetical protein [Lentisphaerota bacterium]MBT7054463.1 hypothetical protein [Lentisphaerota bacterium]MBT7848723.1 hypothetical protein [Lentisphaerota bacterium]
MQRVTPFCLASLIVFGACRMLLVPDPTTAQNPGKVAYPPVVLSGAELAAEHARIKSRYTTFLLGTEGTFTGAYGEEAAAGFLDRIGWGIGKAIAFDFSKDADKTFAAFEGAPGYKAEKSVYSVILQQYLLGLAYGYCVNAPGSPHYRNPAVLERYIQCLEYLYGRGIRAGMTFHNNENRMNMVGAPKPEGGAGNIVKMELRMGAYCQSVLLMEPHFRNTPTFAKARALVRHLEMLGKTSGHVRYYEPYVSPPGFTYRMQSDAIQNYGDTTLVSALLETGAERRAEMLLEAQRVFTDSLKVIPGWADTIKPDFTGFHHRGIYGSAYTGGFIPQAAFGVHLLAGTHVAVAPESVENLKRLILTYRLYCQKYAMPFGIRGRMPVSTANIKIQAFSGILIYASALGLDDAEMKGVFARLWDRDSVGLRFLFTGGRGKILRGMYALDMLRELDASAPVPEPDPSGFWYKPYGGLAIHRRDNWMVAMKGHSKYIWDFESGKESENVYGQYVSHGALTIFSRGDPISDIASGYNLNEGWDWHRMPGTTAVHFPIKPQEPLKHRQFSPETFLGGVSPDGENGVFGMILNRDEAADGTRIGLKAHKSAFFVDDSIVLLGSGICGGDGVHPVETTLFQSSVPGEAEFELSETNLVDPSGNTYHVPDASRLRLFAGEQESFRDDGKTPSKGNYAVAWIDHGLRPVNAGYEVAIGVRGAARRRYEVLRRDSSLHQIRFLEEKLMGYAFFEAVPVDGAVVESVSDACLVMVKETTDGAILGVANPDLGFLPPDADTPTFRFVASDQNQYLPSQPRPVVVTLKGSWGLPAPAGGVAVVSRTGKHTALRFACQHGMGIRVGLVRR